LYKNVNYSNYI